MRLTFKGRIWRWKGDAPAAWHFITLPEDIAAQVKFVTGPRKGFGTVRLAAQIGETRWKTSLFPDTKSGSYLLPVKADVRRVEDLRDGQTAVVELTLDA